MYFVFFSSFYSSSSFTATFNDRTVKKSNDVEKEKGGEGRQGEWGWVRVLKICDDAFLLHPPLFLTTIAIAINFSARVPASRSRHNFCSLCLYFLPGGFMRHLFSAGRLITFISIFRVLLSYSSPPSSPSPPALGARVSNNVSPHQNLHPFATLTAFPGYFSSLLR